MFPVYANVVVDDHYVNIGQLMLQTNFQTFQGLSANECCMYCSQTTECKSVSFKSSSGECLLSNVPDVAVEVDGTLSTGWITFVRRNGKTIFMA